MYEKIKYKITKITKVEQITDCQKIAAKNVKEVGFILKQTMADAVKRNEFLIALKEDNEQVIGFVNFHKRKDGFTIIYEIVVDDTFRGNGIGKALVNRLELPIQLKTVVDMPSNNFYKHLGFILTGFDSGKKRPLNIWTKVT